VDSLGKVVNNFLLITFIFYYNISDFFYITSQKNTVTLISVEAVEHDSAIFKTG